MMPSSMSNIQRQALWQKKTRLYLEVRCRSHNTGIFRYLANGSEDGYDADNDARGENG